MRFKRARLGPRLLREAEREDLCGQVHVVIGGTGAVGGATVLQLLSMFEEALAWRRRKGLPCEPAPRIVVTARSKDEIRLFTSLLFKIQERDHQGRPTRLAGKGYRTCGGVSIELETFAIDPTIPELAGFAVLDEAGERRAVARFLEAGGAGIGAGPQERRALLEQALRERVRRPFSDFLARYAEREGLARGTRAFRSLVVGIPMASVATYKLADLEAAGAHLGVEPGGAAMTRLKELYLEAIVDDLAEVARGEAREVLVAHTTAVGGMYDEEQEGERRIRLGFAHSAKGELLRSKQDFATRLTELYAARDIKMLITAAAIGIDAILVHERIPLHGRIRQKLEKLAAEGHELVPPGERSAVHVWPPARVPLEATEGERLAFAKGRRLEVEYSIRSGENGFFSVSDADALYRVMRVTSASELGHLMARTALLGDDPGAPAFTGNVCYYTESDNSRQVFDLLADPHLLRNQLSGLEPKALQDLGSSKHQAELHALGLLILLQRLSSLDLEALPRRAAVINFSPRHFFEEHSRPLTLERVQSWQAAELAERLALLVRAREPAELEPLLGEIPSASDRGILHRVLEEVLQAVWAVPSLGTPIVIEEEGRATVHSGPFAAPLDELVPHGGAIGARLRAEFAAAGGGSDEERARFVEWTLAAHGFLDLRPRAVLVIARSAAEGLAGKVQVFEREGQLEAALGELEPYTYFATAGLFALLLRLRGLARLAGEFRLELGSANEHRAHFAHDARGRALLVPGVAEAFRMVQEGLEKNTGSERLDGGWGYPRG